MATTDLHSQIATTLDALGEVVEAKSLQWLAARDSTAFRELELDVARVFREGADEVSGHLLRAIVADRDYVLETRKAARAGLGKLRNSGTRTATVTLLGGRTLPPLR